MLWCRRELKLQNDLWSIVQIVNTYMNNCATKQTIMMSEQHSKSTIPSNSNIHDKAILDIDHQAKDQSTNDVSKWSKTILLKRYMLNSYVHCSTKYSAIQLHEWNISALQISFFSFTSPTQIFQLVHFITNTASTSARKTSKKLKYDS